jgi:hypothetical protein
MAQDKVLHGAIAIVRVNGTPVGRMKDVRIQEAFQRSDVGGLGTIFTEEAPVTKFRGTLSCSFYEIDFKKSGINGAVRRDVQTKQEFQDQLTLAYDGVQVDIFKQIEDVIDPNTKLIKSKLTPYAIVKRCLIENDSVVITEGAAAGRDQSFQYLDPVIEPK